MEDSVVTSAEIFSTLHSANAYGIINDFDGGDSKQKTRWRRKVQLRIKDPFLCFYLTTKIPSIRDKTTAVKAIIPDLTLIKVIIVWFFF